MCSSGVTLSSAQTDSHGTELGRRVHVTTGPELLSKEHDLSKYVPCRRDNYECLPNG